MRNLFMALATARFALWMAIFGLVGSSAAVLLSVLVKNKALKEVVGNVQDIKGAARDSNDKRNLRENISETLKKQTKSTKKLVKKIKAKL